MLKQKNSTASSPKSSPERIFSPYEKTHLKRFGGPDNLQQFGSMPVEYITGKTEFNGLVFSVTPAVLIPRIETERLAQLALSEAELLLKKKRVNTHIFTVADVGTGCGAVIIYLAWKLQQLYPKLEVRYIASDISSEAIAVARINAARLVPATHIEFMTSDLLKNFPQASIDLLVANLPYIPSGRIPVLDESVKAYEPHLALDGGKDGLQLINRLLKTAPKYLDAHATILLEVDYTHDQSAFQSHAQTWRTQVFVDEFSRNRFARLQLKNGT